MNFVTVKEARKKYPVSGQTFYTWMKKGKVAKKKETVNGKVVKLIDLTALDAVAATGSWKNRKRTYKKKLMSMDITTPITTTLASTDTTATDYVVALIVPIGSAKSIINRVLG